VPVRSVLSVAVMVAVVAFVVVEPRVVCSFLPLRIAVVVLLVVESKVA